MKLRNIKYSYCDRWTDEGSFLFANMLKRTLLIFVMTVLPITIFANDALIYFYGPLFFEIDITNKPHQLEEILSGQYFHNTLEILLFQAK